MPETGSFSASLGGFGVSVDYKVYSDHSAKATFTYLGSSYEFEMSRWKGKAFTGKYLL
jgi:hypothetical protein